MTTSPPSDWWSTFFSGPVLDAQRKMFSEEQTVADAGAIVRLLEPAPGAMLLDVPCGNGRIALELARRGFRLTGVDLTAAMLDDARDAARRADLEIELRQAEMRDLPWQEAFDGAFCFGNSFGYLDEPGDCDFARAVYRALQPGGGLLVQAYMAMESILRIAPSRSWYEMDETLLLHDPQYDPLAGRMTTTYTFMKDGNVDRREAVYRIYTVRQLVELMEAAGFGQVTAFGSADGEPFTAESTVMYLLARKS